MVLPDAIDDDAGGEGVGLVGEPFGEGCAPSGGGGAFGDPEGGGVENGERAGCDVAQAVFFGDARFGSDRADIGDGENAWERLRFLGIERGEIALEADVAIFIVAAQVVKQMVPFLEDLAESEVVDLQVARGEFGGMASEDGLDIVRKLFDGGFFGAGFWTCLHFGEGAALFGGEGEPVGVAALPGGALIGGGSIEIVAPAERRECGAEAEVIFLEDGIELVVVAAGALDPDAHEDIADDVCDFVEDEVPLSDGVAVVVFVRSEAEETGGGEGFGIVGIEFVAGELFAEEAVVGFIFLKGADDVIAVAECFGAEAVDAVAVALCESDEVEPMSGPFHAMSRGVEEAVDGVGEGLGGGIVFEGLDFFGGWGEAGEVECDAAQEGVRVGFGCGDETVFTEACFDEGVDGVLGAYGGNGRVGDGLDGPPLAIFGGDFVALTSDHFLRGIFGPRRSSDDPTP